MNEFIYYYEDLKRMLEKIRRLNGGSIDKPVKDVLITFDSQRYNIYNTTTSDFFVEFLNLEFFQFLAKELNVSLKNDITISAEYFLKEIMGL